MKHGIRDRAAGTIQIPRNANRPQQVPGSVDANEVLHCPGVRGSLARLATCDGVNHQDFSLFARDFLDAFTCRHVERLRAGLGFIFGNNPVYFVHVGRFQIVFEKCPIAVG